MPRPRPPRHRRRTPLQTITPSRDICLELEDHSRVTRSAVDFFGDSRASADPMGQAARLADQFITQNAPLFRLLDVRVQRDYDGADVLLHIESGNAVGAIPLVSPMTARPDFGLVIQPRFPWTGIGPMLAEMGWLITPTPLKLPLLKRSERRVPPWVLSFMVLARLKALLDRLERRFELTTELTSSPKGTIDWTSYATSQLPRGGFLSVPCTFPDLRDDRQLKGAIRFAVEKQMRSLQTQHEHGTFIHQLIALAESLWQRVRTVPARRPGLHDVEIWLRRPMRTATLSEGLQAIDWTVDERGLAGDSELEGLPWTMPMDQFFEAWVETVMRDVARSTGATVKSGRRRETVAPLAWIRHTLAHSVRLFPTLCSSQSGPHSSSMRSTSVTGRNSKGTHGTTKTPNCASSIGPTFSRCSLTPTWPPHSISSAVSSIPAHREHGNPLPREGDYSIERNFRIEAAACRFGSQQSPWAPL